jgi:ribosomal protein L36
MSTFFLIEEDDCKVVKSLKALTMINTKPGYKLFSIKYCELIRHKARRYTILQS